MSFGLSNQSAKSMESLKTKTKLKQKGTEKKAECLFLKIVWKLYETRKQKGEEPVEKGNKRDERQERITTKKRKERT